MESFFDCRRAIVERVQNSTELLFRQTICDTKRILVNQLAYLTSKLVQRSGNPLQEHRTKR